MDNKELLEALAKICPPPDSYVIKEEKAAIEQAKKRGMTVVQGDNNTLLLDLDASKDVERFKEMHPMVDKYFGIVSEEYWPSKSGLPHLHVKLIIKASLGPAERIALQTILGSDPKHECFGLVKFTQGHKEPSLLFKPGEHDDY